MEFNIKKVKIKKEKKEVFPAHRYEATPDKIKEVKVEQSKITKHKWDIKLPKGNKKPGDICKNPVVEYTGTKEELVSYMTELKLEFGSDYMPLPDNMVRLGPKALKKIK